MNRLARFLLSVFDDTDVMEALMVVLVVVAPYAVGYFASYTLFVTPPAVNLFIFDQILIWFVGFAILLLITFVGWVGYSCFKVAVRIFDLWRESK